MEQKVDFIKLVENGSFSISELCRRFNISRKTGYKWINRYRKDGDEGLKNRSRRPHNSPSKTTNKIERIIIKIRNGEPEWGAKKIHKILLRDYSFKAIDIPSITTINNILSRRGLVNQSKTLNGKSFQRFEHERPNELWQMDFKGDFPLRSKKRCFPLTITDDHSRYNLCLKALNNQQYLTVKQELTSVFRQYGLPDRILCDNGSPWGMTGNNYRHDDCRITRFEKWLLDLRVSMTHCRPHHPQTQGKLERYHRTLKLELLKYNNYKNYNDCQRSFDEWRNKYNYIRPHEALNQETPSSRYVSSHRVMPEKIPAFEYPETDYKRKVDMKGTISFKGKPIRVGKALYGDYVAIRWEGLNQFGIYYCTKKIKSIIKT